MKIVVPLNLFPFHFCLRELLAYTVLAAHKSEKAASGRPYIAGGVRSDWIVA
jgi:hypothetical protein